MENLINLFAHRTFYKMNACRKKLILPFLNDTSLLGLVGSVVNFAEPVDILTL